MKKFLLLGFILIVQFSFAQQSKIDSLLNQLHHSEEDAAKVNIYLSIASHYLVTQIDSSLPYSQKGLQLARKIGFNNGIVHCLNGIGNYHERKGLYEKALQSYNEALALSKKNNFNSGLAMAYNNIAIIHTRKGTYKEALELYFEALKVEEIEGNKKGIAETYNNIGVVYYYQQNIDKTLEYFEKSIAIEEALGAVDVLKKGYNNLGALYNYQEKFPEALAYYHKALALSIKLDDKKEISLNLNNIAVAHHHLLDIDSAFWYLNQSIALKEKLEDYYGIAYAYHNFGSISFDKGNIPDAELFYNKSLKISKEKNLKEIQSQSYKNLSALYVSKNQHQKANEFLLLHISLKDSLISEQSAKAVAEVESKYETAKKEKEILEKQTQIDKQNIEIKQKNIQLLLGSSLGIILLLLFLLVFNYQHQRNKQLEKENLLKEAISKIAIQENLQEQRFRISRDLHDNIGSQLTFIISSIDNLKYGFQLSDNKLTDKLKSISSFTATTISELRDTIWAMNQTAISCEDLKSRIQHFLSNAKNSTEEIIFSFEISPDIHPSYTLSSLEGINIYRIIQEATNNALKYSKATKVRIFIAKKDNNLLFQITDNGIGFDTNETMMGYGLQNMQKRAAEINAIIKIDSTKQKGSAVVVALPTKG